ncbi:hypothetical protein ACLKA7_003510 [Drosophila subpalustris]
MFCCCLCLWHVACPSNCLADEVFEVLPQTSQTSATTTKTANRQDEVNVLAIVTPNATTAPRLDPNNNNEWRPLGHGDPLQKDPTYDYSPPALDRVRYWAENNGSNQDARQKLPPEVLRNKTKSEILLLGVASQREDRLRTAQVKLTSPYVQQQQQQQQQQAKYAAIRRSYYAPQQQQQHRPHTHLMPPPMMTKGLGSHVEYRHSVMNSPSSSSYMSMNMANSYSSPSSSSLNKPMSSTHFYSSPSTATSSWYSHSSPSMSSLPQRMSYGDAHHQESMQHYSFSRPNSIGSNSHNNKLVAPRKPWLHELLQKELVKPTTMKQRMKPTMPATKYLMGTTRPQQSLTHPTYAPLTYAPVTFVPGPPTIETPTTSTSSPPIPEIYITPTTLTPTFNAGFRPMSSTTTTTTTTPQPVTMTTLSSSRLMIPQTSNLSRRPTVAPAPELTTDALFSHYKQPPKPLLGPMYLIIEGHSKVKTYGQNELDPHSPKIVPVISKREPVVRIADPNEKRGTVETYQVKHLHTKTMPLTTTTTATPATTTTTTTTTTAKPIAISFNSSNSTTTTTTTPPPSDVQDLLSLLDNMFQDAHEIVSSSTTTTTESSKTILKPVTTATTTKLLPQQQQQQPEPRIASKANSIESLLEEAEFKEKGEGKEQADEVKYGSEIATSTEPEQPPRATRQIFDYDQLPESRIKNEDNDYEDDQVELDEDEEEEAELLEDGELDVSEDDETSDSEHNLIKRIDKFVDDVDDDGDDDLDDLIEGLSPGNDDDDDQDIEKQLRIH